MKRKVVSIIVVVIVAFVTGAVVWGYSLLGRIERNKIPKSNEELGIKEPQGDKAVEKKEEPVINIVFFGLDRRESDVSSRSDSIMVVSIDSKNQRVKVTSFMRDMYVPIPGHGETRINHAYAYGGPILSIKTINSNFGLDIRNYVTVDFFGLEKLIDKIGGIEINISDAEAKVMRLYIKEVNQLSGNSAAFVNGGVQRLNGRQAVAYSRIRYVGNSDYERTERQRRVLNEVFKKIKRSGITKLPGILSTILPYVETSLSNGEILELASKAMEFNTENIEQFRLPVDGLFKGQKIRGMAVLVLDIEANKKKLHEFIYGK